MGETKEGIAVIDEDVIKSKIHIIRNQKVMLDADLAEIYGYSTKAFNQQVKRNIEKFPEDFMFQLTMKDVDFVRSQFVTSRNETLFSGQEGGQRYLPYAFTEQGIYMLMTVLKGDLAIKQSKALIRTFKKMKDFLTDNQNLLANEELLRLSMQTTQNTADIAFLKEKMIDRGDLTKIIKNFNDAAVRKEYLIYNGKMVEAALAYQQIYSLAKNSIYIVDNYIGLKTLLPLKEAKTGVTCIIFSDNLMKGLHQAEYDDFIKEYPTVSVSFQKTCNAYHDRYIVLDYKKKSERIFHCGTSAKDAGKRVTTITQIADKAVYYPLVDTLLSNPILSLSGVGRNS